MNTAIIVARKIDFPLQRIIANESIYEASVSELMSIISRVEDSVETLMVFGHNPSFTSLVNQLQTEPMYNLPTTGTVGIALRIDRWADVGKKKGERLFTLLPRELD
jgi:phosphohistidine phosphatase